MITRKKKQQQIILSLFLLYFAVYAISPLSNIGPSNLGDEHVYVEQNKAASFKNTHIFFLDIFFSRFTGQRDTNDSTSRLVLFKKTKAVIQSLIDTKYKLAKISENVGNQLVLDSLLFTDREAPERSSKPYDSFLAVFSGLSPPSV